MIPCEKYWWLNNDKMLCRDSTWRLSRYKAPNIMWNHYIRFVSDSSAVMGNKHYVPGGREDCHDPPTPPTPMTTLDFRRCNECCGECHLSWPRGSRAPCNSSAPEAGQTRGLCVKMILSRNGQMDLLTSGSSPLSRASKRKGVGVGGEQQQQKKKFS